MNGIKDTVDNKSNDKIDKLKEHLDKKKYKENENIVISKKSVEELGNIKFVIDIPVDLTVELGKIQLKIKDLLNLSKGSILTLNKYSGEPLNILVNKFVIAKGELVIVEEKYGIRITSIVDNSRYLNHID
ncbi:MAG: flagellar motor switch protein FliN [Buchnera aphidicola (Meitanaphis microgallis)]